jgi:Sap, sulfolipid-1-addressing protein
MRAATPKWRNWQTRRTQNPVALWAVWVRLPPSALLIEIFFLAVGSMFWPVLLAVDVVAFKTDRPVRILGGFLAGGLLATVTVGIAIVFWLNDTDLVSNSRHTTDATVSIVVGAAALATAFFIRRGGKQRAAKPAPHGSSKAERLVAHGAVLAFLTGIVLAVFPGLLPFIAMKDIAELDYTTSATIAVIVAFYLVMFAPVEMPIVGFLVAPRWTAEAVASFNVWLARNLRTLAWSALAIFGAFEIVRGIFAA